MPEGPPLAGRKERERAAREARLAAALRENLRRRKEQARAQTAGRDVLSDSPASLSGTALSGKSGGRGEDIAD